MTHRSTISSMRLPLLLLSLTPLLQAQCILTDHPLQCLTPAQLAALLPPLPVAPPATTLPSLTITGSLSVGQIFSYGLSVTGTTDLWGNTSQAIGTLTVNSGAAITLQPGAIATGFPAGNTTTLPPGTEVSLAGGVGTVFTWGPTFNCLSDANLDVTCGTNTALVPILYTDNNLNPLVPASSTTPCSGPMIAYGQTAGIWYRYDCVAPNTWTKTALGSW